MLHKATQMKSNSLLQYYITSEPTAFSLSPYDSDALGNLTVMEQVVGTLLKYGGEARYEPYLAQSWQVSADKKKWTFKFRQGLRDESGEIITPDSYVYSLKLILKHLSKEDPHLPVFETLLGWDQFTKKNTSSDLAGILTDSGSVSFLFTHHPEGFLEYLSMPYYGYYNKNNFENGEWKSRTSLIASGAFRVEKIEGNQVLLKKRENWFSHAEQSADNVMIKNENYAFAKEKSGHVIIFKKVDKKTELPKGYRYVSATPTILNAVVLTPFRSTLFNDANNRYLFYSRLKKAQKQIELDSENAVLSDFFYPTSKTEVHTPNSEYFNFKRHGDDPLKILLSSTVTESEADYFKRLIRLVLQEEIPYEFIKEDRTKHGWFQEVTSNKLYDIRLARVDVGGNLDIWGIKMMFCSSLGVGFPDYRGSMKSLVGQAEHDLISGDAYAKKFNQTILDDMTMIPLWHSGLSWLFSDNISLAHINPTMSLPRFDLLSLQ